jgi:hypothetical protein
VQLDYVPDLSSHSLRRGMATSAHRAGANFRDIKKQGGWRHDGTVQGYIEEAGRFEEKPLGVCCARGSNRPVGLAPDFLRILCPPLRSTGSDLLKGSCLYYSLVLRRTGN